MTNARLEIPHPYEDIGEKLEKLSDYVVTIGEDDKKKVEELKTAFETWCRDHNPKDVRDSTKRLGQIYGRVLFMEWRLNQAEASYEQSCILYLAQVCSTFQDKIISYVRLGKKPREKISHSKRRSLDKHLQELYKDMAYAQSVDGDEEKRWKEVCKLFSWPSGVWERDKDAFKENECIKSLLDHRIAYAHPQDIDIEMARSIYQDYKKQFKSAYGFKYFDKILSKYELLNTKFV